MEGFELIKLSFTYLNLNDTTTPTMWHGDAEYNNNDRLVIRLNPHFSQRNIPILDCRNNTISSVQFTSDNK